MATVGIQDIETRADEIVRRVRDEHETIELTYLGETVGQIAPVRTRVDREAIEKSWKEWQDFFDRIADHVVDDATLEDTMNEIRRTL